LRTQHYDNIFTLESRYIFL